MFCEWNIFLADVLPVQPAFCASLQRATYSQKLPQTPLQTTASHRSSSRPKPSPRSKPSKRIFVLTYPCMSDATEQSRSQIRWRARGGHRRQHASRPSRTQILRFLLLCSGDESLKASGYLSEFLRNPGSDASAFNTAFKTPATMWEWREEAGNSWRARRFAVGMKGGGDIFPASIFTEGRPCAFFFMTLSTTIPRRCR